MGEVQTFGQRYRSSFRLPVDIEERVRFNPNLTKSWFASVVAAIDNITMLAVLLTGAALIRERERGTVEHLLVMPVTPFEIMTSKVWSMGLVVLVASALSVKFVVEGLLAIPLHGSIPLFVCGTALYLFAATSLGMFLATFARTMPQFALLMILVILPLQMLSGGTTPRESIPPIRSAGSCSAVGFLVLSEYSSNYTVVDYGLRHGNLPLGGVALLAQPGWAPGIVLFGLSSCCSPTAAALLALAVAGGRLRGGGRAVDGRRTVVSPRAPWPTTAPRWTPAGTCCCSAATAPAAGGTWCRACSSRCSSPAGWPRSPARRSATGARQGNGGSS